MKFVTVVRAALLGAALTMTTGLAHAQDSVPPGYYYALKGKKVGFVPISMGFDLTKGWLAGMKLQADAKGYEIIVRDPNWSVEAGIQAITSLIEEHPICWSFRTTTTSPTTGWSSRPQRRAFWSFRCSKVSRPNRMPLSCQIGTTSAL